MSADKRQAQDLLPAFCGDTMDNIIDEILDEYRKNFENGIIPHEDKLRIAFYRRFGGMIISEGEITTMNEEGKIVFRERLESK